MEWVEISAKTVEEAKDRALDRLGVDERDAEFEIIEEPRVGIFGRAKGEARVRARVKPTAPRPKVDGRARKRADKPAAEKPAADKLPPKRAPRKAAAAVATEADADAATPAPAVAEEHERPSRSVDSKHSDLDDLDLGQQSEIVAEVVQGIVGALGLEAGVTTRGVDEDTAEVTVTGEELGFLVGPRGRTLHALNEVTRSVVLRRGNAAPSARVHVDVAGYRQRRRDALAAFSVATAAKVRETGMAHALEPMGSADRKVVHDTVADIDGVASLSEGEDHDRRVVIVPA